MNKLRLSIFVIFVTMPLMVLGLGLGKIEVKSYLNQPFNAEIPLIGLHGTPYNDIRVTLADSEMYKRLKLEHPNILTQFKFSVHPHKNNSAYIKIISEQPVKEPYLQLLINTQWSGNQMAREYNILLDPQEYVNLDKAAKTENKPIIKKATKKLETYGPTKHNENLWEIAHKVKKDHPISTSQMMMALFNKNPTAFHRNNINGLKEKQMLTIPELNEAKKLSEQEAAKKVRLQDIAWHHPSKTNTENFVPEQPQYIAESTVAQEEQKALDDSLAAQAVLSKMPYRQYTQNTSTANQTASINNSTAEQVLSEQVKELTEYKENLQTMIQQQASEIQQLKQQIAAIQKPQAVAAAKKIVSSPSPITMPTTSASKSTSTSFSKILAANIVTLIVIGLIAFFWFRNRHEETDDMDEVLMDEVVASSESESQERISPALTPTEVQPQESIEDDKVIAEIIEEADVYITYKRYEQAESLLQEALAKYPTQHQIAIKLLEVYAIMGNEDGYTEIMSLLPEAMVPEDFSDAKNNQGPAIGLSDTSGHTIDFDTPEANKKPGDNAPI